MPSLADVDLDGDLDLLIGQSFNRLLKQQRVKAALASGTLRKDLSDSTMPEPQARLYLNESSQGRRSLILHLIGDKKKGVSSSAIGAIVRVTADTDGDSNTPELVQSRQLLGPGGHSGKQNETIIHVGLGDATYATRVKIQWPGDNQNPTELGKLRPGRYIISQENPIPQLLSK